MLYVFKGSLLHVSRIEIHWSKQNFDRIYGNKNIRISKGVNLLSVSTVCRFSK